MNTKADKYGLSIRLNKICTFDGLMSVGSENRTTTTIVAQNPGWLGQPFLFRIPVVTFKDDEDGGQRPAIIVVNANMYQMRLGNGTPWLIIELNKNSNEFWVIEKVVDKKERVGLKLSYASLVLNTRDAPTAKNHDIMMTLWGTDDVEAMLSGFFSGYSMHTLYIGSLKKEAVKE